jgi:SAM-dependent methyltransferase
MVRRKFTDALLIGCPDQRWPDRLREFADRVDVLDPGSMFAMAAGGEQVVEDAWMIADVAYDLVVAIGTLDTVNDLPNALRSLRLAMRPDGLFIGALSGGDTLPQLRHAMRAADDVVGGALPHVHPRIEAAALAPLLSAAGFAMPVVDVDRVRVSYRSLDRLVSDLRRMGATNLLAQRARRPLPRAAHAAARQAWAAAGDGARTAETFEILHFAAWTASAKQG